jgi:hypothetical protein
MRANVGMKDITSTASILHCIQFQNLIGIVMIARVDSIFPMGLLQAVEVFNFVPIKNSQVKVVSHLDHKCS